MKSHILINIKNNSTELCYINEGEKLHSHVYDYGYSYGEDKALFLEGIMYMLEHINTVESIPNTFRLNIIEDNTQKEINSRLIDNPMRHKVHWYKFILENYNYTQFDRDGNTRACVIIDNDERYKKSNKLGLKI